MGLLAVKDVGILTKYSGCLCYVESDKKKYTDMNCFSASSPTTPRQLSYILDYNLFPVLHFISKALALDPLFWRSCRTLGLFDDGSAIIFQSEFTCTSPHLTLKIIKLQQQFWWPNDEISYGIINNFEKNLSYRVTHSKVSFLQPAFIEKSWAVSKGSIQRSKTTRK